MAETEQRVGSERERRTQGSEGAGRCEERGRAYVAPRLERVGEWKALTLQQSVPIHGYNVLIPEVTRRLG